MLGLLIVWFTWDYTTNFLNNITNTTFSYILWGSFVIAVTTFLIVVPLLIAFSDGTGANIISAAMGYGFFSMMMIFNRIIWPFFDSFIGTSQPFFTDSLMIKVISFSYLVIAALSLYIVPVAISTVPDVLQEKLT